MTSTDLFRRKVIDSFRGEHDFLSNFYLCPVGKYASAEHAYQAAKCASSIERDLFLNPKLTAGQAKRLGQKVVQRLDWEDIKVDVMLEVVRAKFYHNENLAQKLLDTGDAILIEGNTWGDVFWGQCDGKGKNVLGLILENVRESLQIKHDYKT